MVSPSPHSRRPSGPRARSRSIGSTSGRLSIARESLWRDIEAWDEEDEEHREQPLARHASNRDNHGQIGNDSESDSDNGHLTHSQDFSQYSILSSYHRPSIIGMGQARSTVLPSLDGPIASSLTEAEREEARAEERSLLRDNRLIPRKHPRGKRTSYGSQAQGLLSSLQQRPSSQDDSDDERTITGVDGITNGTSNGEASETTPLIVKNLGLPYGGEDNPETIDQKWEDAVKAGKIKTTWQREALVLWRYCRSLILTFLLQYSLPTTSVFTVGHLGRTELGAISLASMTANITGYAVYQGLATSLDTLCAQAYGSGRKTLVGLQFQRMVYFLWLCTIPIGIIWICSPYILGAIVPEKETARLAGLYLRITLLGAPSYAVFEAGKRFVQAQGRFAATTGVLLIVAPLNIVMHYLFVFHFKWGFVGAPIAVALTETLMPILLFLYVWFFGGLECWGGFSKAALRNWRPIVQLGGAGLIMVLSEYFAFEILTLSTSFIGEAELASQSVLSTVVTFTWNIPYPIGVAASTRIANLIGATLADAGKVTARVALVIAVAVGVINMVALSCLRQYIPRLFTSDAEVIEIVARVLPLCAAFQLFDALTANCNGILRGIGRQEIGGVINVICYYAVAMPISFGLGFGLHLELLGLWTGVAIALALVAAIEGYFIFTADWNRAVEEATKRNLAS